MEYFFYKLVGVIECVEGIIFCGVIWIKVFGIYKVFCRVGYIKLIFKV